jgi:hypothetical protein
MSDPTHLCAGGQFQPPSPSGVRLDRSQGLRICFASDSRLPRSGQFPASSSKSSCRSPPTPLRIAILKQFLWLSCHIEVFPNRQHSCRCFLQITWLLTGNRGRPLPNPPAQRCASRPSGDRCRERLPCCRETRTRHCRAGSSAVAILALPT